MNFSTATSMDRLPFAKNRLLQIFIVSFFIFWISTLLGTTDLANWFMENTLVIIFLSLLAVTYRKFKFSDLTYTFIFVYLSLHIYGAMYTYAENPFGYWMKEAFHFNRNHYDRIVHFSFGFMLAYPMRDFFLNKMQFPKWVGWLLPIEITLSFSCLYELIEWAVADVFFPEQGIAYLGTQGDIWDAQKDMFMAFCGAVLIILIVSIIKKIGRKN
jgi:putative membrane protein